MTAVMVPAVTAGGGGTGTLAFNQRGRATVTPSATATLVSFVSGAHFLRGFHVTGNGDGFAWIEIDGDPLDGMAARMSIVKDAYRVLPNPEAYPSSGAIVALKVTNDSDVTIEFEGVVFGE